MDQDTTSGTPQASQDPQGSPNDPQTRRKFLRTAVIGAAGVAGGTAIAGAILARQSPGLLTGQFALGSNLSLQDNNCSTCLTGSNYVQVGKDSGTGNYLYTVQVNNHGKVVSGPNSPGSLFFWFTAPGLTGGSDPGGTAYDFSFSYTPYDSNAPAFTPHGNNPYFRDVYSNGAAPSCPTSDPSKVSGVTEVNESCVSGSGCIFPYTVPQNQTQDVQFHAHLDYSGDYPGLNQIDTYTFTFTLTTTGQASPVCTGTITLEVKGV